MLNEFENFKGFWNSPWGETDTNHCGLLTKLMEPSLQCLHVDLFHNGGLLIYSFICLIISFSDLVWKWEFFCFFHMLMRSERLIIIPIKGYINRPPFWERSTLWHLNFYIVIKVFDCRFLFWSVGIGCVITVGAMGLMATNNLPKKQRWTRHWNYKADQMPILLTFKSRNVAAKQDTDF